MDGGWAGWDTLHDQTAQIKDRFSRPWAKHGHPHSYHAHCTPQGAQCNAISMYMDANDKFQAEHECCSLRAAWA